MRRPWGSVEARGVDRWTDKALETVREKDPGCIQEAFLEEGAYRSFKNSDVYSHPCPLPTAT